MERRFWIVDSNSEVGENGGRIFFVKLAWGIQNSYVFWGGDGYLSAVVGTSDTGFEVTKELMLLVTDEEYRKALAANNVEEIFYVSEQKCY